jgi:hypothetical protein
MECLGSLECFLEEATKNDVSLSQLLGELYCHLRARLLLSCSRARNAYLGYPGAAVQEAVIVADTAKTMVAKSAT